MKEIKFNSEKIKQVARRKKILLKEMYQALDISRQHFDHLLKGETLSVAKLAVICQILDCTPNDFYDIVTNVVISDNMAAEDQADYNKSLPKQE